MRIIIYQLLLLCISNDLFARLPCDGNLDLTKDLTPQESRTLMLVDELSLSLDKSHYFDEIERSVRETLRSKDIEFFEKSVMLTDSELLKIPEAYRSKVREAKFFEITESNKIAQKFSQKFHGLKLYYSPQAELLRAHNPNYLLKLHDGVVVGVKDLYFLEAGDVISRFEKNAESVFHSYNTIPPVDSPLFDKYLDDLRNHLIKKGIDYAEEGVGRDVLFRILNDTDVSKLNKLSKSIHEKFNQASLVYHPYAIKTAGAAGMFSPSKNMVYVSHQSILDAKVDYVIVHELMHANINNKFLKEFKYSPFHGKVFPNEGQELSNMSAYKKYMNFEEVTTHALNVHMAAKKTFYGMNGGIAKSQDFNFLFRKTQMAREISQKASDIIETGLNQIDQIGRGGETANWLRGAQGKGFLMHIKNDEYNSTLQLFFRDEPESIRLIAQKYLTNKDVVSTSDLIELKSYLKSILVERKMLYQEISDHHQKVLNFLTRKSQSTTPLAFTEDATKQLLTLSQRGRSTALGANFDKAPDLNETQNLLEGFISW
jgi:hypothetical protein